MGDPATVSKPSRKKKREAVCAGNISKTGHGLVMVTLGKNGGEKGGRETVQRKERRHCSPYWRNMERKRGEKKGEGSRERKGEGGETGRREGEEKRGRAALRNERNQWE